MGRVSRGLKHIVFATFELYPVNAGGAGVFISGAVRALSRAGYDITVLCDFPQRELAKANEMLAAERVGSSRLQAVAVSALAHGVTHAPGASIFEINSARVARALENLHAQDPIDLIELPDYAGLAHATLALRQSSTLRDVLMAVRVHGSLELIDRAEGVVPNAERLGMYRLEQEGIRAADVLFVPSMSMGRMYANFYGASEERMVLSPPPMEMLLAGLSRAERLPDPGHFLFYGKLQEVKGVLTLIDAAVSLLVEHPPRHWRFTFVGRDAFSERYQRMLSALIRERIPTSVADNFEFYPSIDRLDLRHLASRPVAAVVPSHFETFCLAAHELRAVGLPLVVPRIPAFVDYLNEAHGCLTYDGTALDLREKLKAVSDDVWLQHRLESAPLPSYQPFVQAYDSLKPTRRARFDPLTAAMAPAAERAGW